MKKILLLLLVGIFLFNLASADLGTYGQGDNISVKGNLNATFVNISIYFPNSSFAVENQAMAQIRGDIWNYYFDNTNTLGIYIYDYCNELGANCKENTFDVTPSGQGGAANIVFFIFIILIIYGITFVGFFGKNIPVTILGGMAMLFLGVYTIQQGLIIYRDTLTLYFSYLTIAIGFIMAAWAILEQFEVL